ncbi:TraB/GumN family protein [Glacieibacterium megasporae]|uniref:TraB/GumN family protein n=1 Tax=Glacieibacterium megasporae TaxID=2835787 RepID=UPI001C1E46EE|nr:TraB/GumN family protein [Polymorphobacter megasporae]UAJ10411.1 TraB/GumN family protein [Polymorphobacter megasporae]
MRLFPLLAAAIVAVPLALAAPAAAEPAMWHVHDADTDITLFGTIHALPAGSKWLSPKIAARVDAADTLVLETVLPDDPAGLGPLVAMLGEKRGLPPLSARVAPSKRAALLAGETALGLPAARLDGMKTWLAAIALGDGAVSQLGLTAGDGVEATLTARAKGQNKPVIGLETPEAQLRLFDNLSETDARALLDSTVDDLSTARDDTNALVAYWQAGETEALAKDFDKGFQATPNLESALLTNRNKAWADWIAARLATPGRVFVAVGAGHLGGRNSVVKLLEAKGLTVERLP